MLLIQSKVALGAWGLGQVKLLVADRLPGLSDLRLLDVAALLCWVQ